VAGLDSSQLNDSGDSCNISMQPDALPDANYRNLNDLILSSNNG